MTKALSDMTDEERHRHYTTASGPELIAAAAAEQEKQAAAKRPARKTAPRRVVINRAGAGQSVPIQAGRIDNSGSSKGSGSGSGAAKKASPRNGGRSTTTFVNNGGTVGLQAGNVNGATVVVNSNGGSSSTAAPRPTTPAAPAKKAAPAAAAAKKAAPAKKVVKKAPAKKTAAKDIPSTPPKPSVADAVAQVKADQEKRLAAEAKARKAAARAATRPGQPEQGPEVTGLPLPTQLPKTAAKKVVKKAPARKPVTFATRHRKVRRAIRLIRRKPHHALGLTLLFVGTGLVHVGIRAGRYSGRKSLAGLRAMGRGYDQYRRMARAAKLEHKHAGCSRCGGTGTIPLRAPDGSYAGSQACRG